jgi:hypothetical protein
MMRRARTCKDYLSTIFEDAREEVILSLKTPCNEFSAWTLANESALFGANPDAASEI